MRSVRAGFVVASAAFVCCLFLAAPLASAQSYTRLTAYSKYYCGHLPNGKNKLFEAHGRRYDSVAFKSAEHAIAANRLQLRERSQSVQRAISNIKNHKPDDPIIALLRKYVSNAVEDPSDPFSDTERQEILFAFSKNKNNPPTKEQRLAALQLFDSGYLQPRIAAAASELAAAKACKSNKLPLFQTAAAIITPFTDFAGTSVVVLLIIDNDGSLYDDELNDDWYCVKNPNATFNGAPANEAAGRGVLFGYNPCHYGSQTGLFQNECSSLLTGHKGKIGAVIRGAEFPRDPEAAAAVLQAQYGGSYSIRQRKNGGDDCHSW